MDAGYIAELLAAQYAGELDQFDYTDQGADTGVFWSAKHCPEGCLILFRGSADRQDWERDLEAIGNPFTHSVFGPLHPGFSKDMEAVWAKIKAQFSGPYIVAGHSLGAARAAIAAAYMKHDGQPPIKRFGFGEPHPGFTKLRLYLAGIPAEIYRNRAVHNDADPVTVIPFWPYVPSGEATELTGTPTRPGPFGLHDIHLYCSLVKSHLAPKS